MARQAAQAENSLERFGLSARLRQRPRCFDAEASSPRRKLPGAGNGQLIDMRPEIIEATSKLAHDYGLNGIFNVQFREAGGKPRLLEINPRMSGGIGMACAAGPNLPWIALKGFADGFATVEVAPVRNGMRVIEVPEALELA